MRKATVRDLRNRYTVLLDYLEEIHTEVETNIKVVGMTGVCLDSKMTGVGMGEWVSE